MLGREVRAPVDIVYGSPPGSCPASYDDYASAMDHRLRLAYTLVRKHLHVAAEKNKRSTICGFVHNATKRAIEFIIITRESTPVARTSDDVSSVGHFLLRRLSVQLM